MAFNRLEVNDLATATLDDSDQVIVGESNTYKKATVSALKNNILGSAPSYTTDTEPYLTRQTAHIGVVGKCALTKLVGGSLGWNQIIPHTASTGTSSGITFTNNNDGSWTLTGTGSSANAFVNLNYVNSTTNCFVPNHIYYATVNKSGSTTLSTIGMLLSGAASDGIYVYSSRIFKAASTLDARGWARLQVTNATNIDIGTVKLWPQIFDLTQMFGDTIADYIYQLENSSSGSGIAWLRKYIDIDSYHAYDAGSIQNVQATAHVTTGFNQWDEAWEVGTILDTNGQNSAATNRIRSTNYIPIFADSSYYIKSPKDVKLYWYDGNKNFISASSGWTRNAIFNPNPSAKYMRFILETSYGTTYANDICVNFSKTSGSPKNGDYVPYNGHSYPLGSDTLRGYPMLVNNKLVFDGDIKTPDGTTRRRYGTVDLGTLTYTSITTSDHTAWRASAPSDSASGAALGGLTNIMCAKYQKADAYFTNDKTMWVNNTSYSSTKYIIIRNDAYASSTEAQFKTAMSGVYLVYPLATETTESSTAFQKIQTISADGTESFTTSSPVPVGHETQTPDNILAALSWVGE